MCKFLCISSLFDFVLIALIYFTVCHISIFGIRFEFSIVATFISRTWRTFIFLTHTWIPCEAAIIANITVLWMVLHPFTFSFRTTSLYHHLCPEELRMIRPNLTSNSRCYRAERWILINSRTFTPFLTTKSLIKFTHTSFNSQRRVTQNIRSTILLWSSIRCVWVNDSHVSILVCTHTKYIMWLVAIWSLRKSLSFLIRSIRFILTH